MPEETKEEASSEEAKVDTSDEALSKAADIENALYEDENNDEEKDEEKESDEEDGKDEEEDVPEEPEDNKERTQLGRKVKAQELIINDLNTKLDLIIANQIDNPPAKETAEDEEYEMDETLTVASLKKLLPKILEEDSKSKAQKHSAYESKFLSEVVSQGNDMDSDVHDAITQILLERYNTITTGDASVDAQLAFLKAERDYSIEKSSGKKKLRGGKAPAVDKPSSDKKGKPAVKMVKLDKHAQAFVDKMGLDAEFVQRALGK